MTVKLKISEFVLTRLRSIKHDVTGGLFGLMYQGNLIILTFNLETESGGLNHKRMQDNFPTEVDLCGLVQIGSSRDAETHLKEILNDIDITDNPILLTSSEDSVKTSLYVHEKLQEIEYEVFSAQDLYREFFFVRARAYLEVVLEPTEKSIKDVLFQLRKKLASGMSSFEFNDSSVILTNGGTFGHDEEEPVSKLIPKKAQGKAKLDFEILDVSLSVKSSPSDEKFSPNAVLFTVNTKPQKLFKLGLSTDVLSMLHINTKLVQLYDILVESNTRVLRLIERHLLVQLKSSQEMREPVIYHFKPEDLGHYFTVIYPEGVSDEDPILTSKRLSLHQHFGLPSLRPVFRRGNAVCFEPSTLLVNPHVGVKGQVLGGQQHLVQGRYSYHHYMQDRFNDDGWGCAYRSLQTLISWFRFQGYSDTAIPTHEEIQKYLHQVGDKPAKFVGSREWIGSMEVAMCLQNFAGVESKIVHVNSGSELAQRGSELAFHFDHQGTPIMIGGGVLAHTILGVDFNPENGEIKFLILDPHYTGADNLETVQSKGWCGWKGANFWDKKSYYNLCMPQRPHVF